MSSRDRERASRKRSMSRSRTPRSRSRSFSPNGRGAPINRDAYGRRAETEDGNPHYSNYYRDRFGSESPQEYQNLRVTNIDPKVSNDELRDALEKYLGRFGDMNVKIIRQMDPYERIAYVNFERAGDARDARHGCLQKLVNMLGRRLTIDPAGVIRDQEGRYVKSTSGGRSPPPPRDMYPPQRDMYAGDRGGSYRDRGDRGGDRDRDRGDYGRDEYSRSSHRSSRDERGSHSSRRNADYSTSASNRERGDYFSPRQANINEGDDEANATRTLFVGSLQSDVAKSDLQHVFNKYGVIEHIDIKNPHDNGPWYAFIRFQNLAMAQEAKRCLAGTCGSWKIGYGKPQLSRRLWVGGLGPNTSLAWLEKEFDRFGAIEKIDFVRGENHAYILFASEEATNEAWRNMKGVQLKDGGEKILLQVDFADSSMYDTSNDAEPSGQTTSEKERERSRDKDRDRDRDRDRERDVKKPPSSENYASSKRSKRPATPPGPPAGSPPAKKESASKRSSSTVGKRAKTPPVPRDSSPVVATPTAAGATSGNAIISDGTVSSTTTSPPFLCEKLSAQTLDELHQVRSPCWTGALVLKKSAYPIRLYKLTGDDDLIDAYLRNERGESVQLTITQRLKLDQPKQDDIQKWLSSPTDQHAFLLAAPNTNVLPAHGSLADLQPRALKLLVKYFKEKDAAGVVSVASNRRAQNQQQQTGILYTFPRCPFADLLTAALCPKLSVLQQCSDDCLLVVLQKGGGT